MNIKEEYNIKMFLNELEISPNTQLNKVTVTQMLELFITSVKTFKWHSHRDLKKQVNTKTPEELWDFHSYTPFTDIITDDNLEALNDKRFMAKEGFVEAMDRCANTKQISFKDIVSLETERLEWSLETFTDATPISSLRKLESEIEEIELNIHEGIKDPVEYADAMMCLLDSAGRDGISIDDILIAYKTKMEINKSRKWVKNPDNSYSHVKSPLTDKH